MTSRLIKQGLISATLITVLGNVLGRLFGFAREAVLAKYFGTSAVLDTFILAFTLPELIALVLFTALPVALIPAVSRAKTDGADESRLFWSGLIWFGLCFGALATATYLLRTQIVGWLGPGLDPAAVAMGSNLLGILAPYIFLRGLEAYFRSWCFAKKHFVAPALSSVILNSAIIASIFLLYDRLEIATLAYGWLAGSVILLIYNGLFAFRMVRPTFRLDLDLPWVRQLLVVLGAVALLETITMAYAVVDRYLASQSLGPGPISALRYASTLISIPGGVLVAAFNIASFPWIAEMVANGQTERLKQMYTDSVRLLVFAMGLIAVGVVIFAEDIVRVAFQRGMFDDLSLALTTGPFIFYAIGLVFQSVYSFQMRFYYARQALVRLGLILIGMFLVKLIASMVLIGPMGHNGLALATSIARILGFTVMTLDLAGHLGVTPRNLFGRFLPKVVVCLALVAACWFGLDKLWPSTPDQALGSLLAKLIGMAVLGVTIYNSMASILKLPEPKRAADMIFAKFRRKR